MTRLVLLSSPLLGPATWASVAAELSRCDLQVTVASCGRQARTPQDVLEDLVAATPDEAGLVLVPHSNSGLYVAALAARRRLAGVVFVDAALPADSATTATAPEGLVDHLARLVRPDGLLPPWTEWWPEAEVAVLFGDDTVRAAVEREQRRLPLAYFRSRVPTPPGWQALPTSYLAFGDTYAEERDLATRRGWAVETLPGGHLHQLVDPAAVAAAVKRLLVPEGGQPAGGRPAD